MKRNFLTRQIFIVALLSFALIQSSYADSFTVNVPNSQGGYTALVIQSSGSGYVGPQGEYYSSFPSVPQLQATYGTGTTTAAVVTTAPSVAVQPSSPDQESYTVNITNSQGGYTPILIRKTDGRFFGPLGENYPNFPTVQALQLNYGPYSPEQIQQANQEPALKSKMLIDQGTRNVEAQTQRELQFKQQADQQAQKSMQEMEQRTKNQQAQQLADAGKDQFGGDGLEGLTPYGKAELEKGIKERQAREEKQAQIAAQKEKGYLSKQPFGIPPNILPLTCFMATMTLLLAGLLVFLLLLHIPNRLIERDQWNHISMVVAVRKGMTQAHFNQKAAKFVFGELFVVAILLAVAFKSFLVFGVAILASFFIYAFRTIGFVILYLLTAIWALLAAELGYLLCGGQFANSGNYISGWVGGIVFLAIGFMLAAGAHFAGTQYMQDL